jgi:TetR/AcrR family transcriptional regulator, mexJK operon transcriptional repressor
VCPERPTSRGSKRRAKFVAVATRLFLERGFEGVTVGEIVKEAGGSLSTLYAYFPCKTDLFQAIAMGGGTNSIAAQVAPEHDDDPVDKTLLRAAQHFLSCVGNPRLIGLFRAMIGAVPRFREEAISFTNCRRSGVLTELENYFARQVAKGRLSMAVEDIPFCAEQFFALIRGTWSVEALMGDERMFNPEYFEKVAREGVATFMARFGRVPPATSMAA